MKGVNLTPVPGSQLSSNGIGGQGITPILAKGETRETSLRHTAC